MLLGCSVERTAQIDDLSVDVERIDGVDAESKALLRIFLNLAGRSSKDGYIDILKFCDILNDSDVSKLCWFVLSTLTAHDSSKLHVWCSLNCIECIFANIAITNDGYTNLFHK